MIKEPNNWVERHGFLLGAVVMIIITAFLTWYAEYDMFESIGYESAEGLPDYEADNLVSMEFRQDGSLHYRLKALKLMHFAEDDHIELDKPQLSLDEDGQVAWLVRSDRGFVSNQQEEVLLAGHVQLERTEPKDPGFVLKTEKLTLFPHREYAHTDQPVVVERSNDRVHSTGVQAWFKAQRIKFLSEVKSYHENIPR